MFQIVQPNVRFRDPLWPASTNEIHMSIVSPIRKQKTLNQNVGKQITKKYGK